MNKEASKVSVRCDGLLLLLYPSGFKYPYSDENIKGSFLNLTLTKTRGHFSRVTLEAVGFMIRQSVDEIARYGITVSEIRSLGGGALSELWRQMKADVTEKSIVTFSDYELTCRGVAAFAAVGWGWFESLEEAVKTGVTLNWIYRPNKKMTTAK